MHARSAETTPDLAACQAILERGSRSFWAASRLLPARVRGPTAALYAFCRVADDEIDRAGPGQSGAALRALERRLGDIFAGTPRADAVDRALARVVAEHALPRVPLEAMLEGFAWDVERRRYQTLAELRAYAARVASTVGVAMTALMGPRDAATLARACDLGVAMQLTNIARDVGEDAREGRLYLPLEWLAEARVDVRRLLRHPQSTTALSGVTRRLCMTAEALYLRADHGVPMLPRDCRPAIRAARLVYADLHRSIARSRWDSVTRRAVVPGRRKLLLLAAALPAALQDVAAHPSTDHLGLVRDPAVPALDPTLRPPGGMAADAPPLPETAFLVEALRRPA